MTKEEVKKLFRLLRASYPQKAEMYEDGGDVMCAWYVILRPYTYDQARRAVTETMKSVRGVINIGDVAVNLPLLQSNAGGREHGYIATTFLMMSRIQRYDALYHAAGILTWEEAENEGQSFEDWLEVRNRTEPFATILNLPKGTKQETVTRIEDEFFRSKGSRERV